MNVNHNYSLTSLSGLDNLTSIGGSLYIDVNVSLTSLNGLDNLTSIDGLLSVVGSTSLISINGLGNLTSIGGVLNVGYNNALTNLNGLGNIDPTTIWSLKIIDCPKLAICEVKSICDYLAIPLNSVTISGNATGCNSQAEVSTACASVGIDEPYRREIQLYPNPTSGTIEIKGLTYGRLRIVNNQGKIVAEKAFSESIIDISDLPSTIYLIQIHSGDQWITQKILKK